MVWAKKACRVSIAEWWADKKKRYKKSINVDKMVFQIAQASCNESVIADFSSNASCELFHLP